MLARYWQINERAALPGDRPQTPYDGVQRTYRSLDGDGNYRPCASSAGKSITQPPRTPQWQTP